MTFLALAFVCLVAALSSCQTVLSSKHVKKEVWQNKLYEKAGGESAPWQVSVQNQQGEHICGGAIIDVSFILTAASCVAGLDEADVRVITGSNSWKQPAATYEVQDVIVHCNFNKSLHHNDVALVKLTTPISYDAQTQNITLANLDELEEGEILTATDWGSPATGKSFSRRLTKSEFKYSSNEDCIETLGEYGAIVDLGQLCALPAESSGDCRADSGTPLVNSKGQLVGIGNRVLPCGQGYAGIFARVSFYSDWIRTSIKGCWLK